MTNDIFTLGIGRVIASGYAMRQCIPYLTWAYRKPLQWIKSHGIDLNRVLYINYETVSDFFNLNDMRIENACEAIGNCEKCAIARQYADVGETMLCKEHYENFSDSDEQQRELIQAWLYPTNDEGEIKTRSEDEIREQLWEDDDSAYNDCTRNRNINNFFLKGKTQ